LSQRDAADAERSRARSSQNGDPGMSATDNRLRPGTAKSVAGLATVAIIGTAIFVVLIAALHFLSPEMNPIERRTSEYAVGPFGYLMTLAFVAMSLATWSLVIGLRRNLSKPAISPLGLGFLGVFGIGLLVAATFPTDLEGAPQTLAGTIHSINGSIAFLSLTVGTNLVSRRLKLDARWLPIHRVASVLALIMIPEFIAGGVAAARETGGGIAQRILLVTFSAWFFVVALRLRANAREALAVST
jgi:hypothetical protein